MKINCFAELNINNDVSSFVENSGTIGQVNTSTQILNYAPPIDDSSTFVVDDYDDFKGHEVMLGLGTWTGSTPLGTTVITNDLFRNFLDLAATSHLGRKLRSFKYVQGKLRATIVVQGSSTAYGKRVISFDPVVMGCGNQNRITTVPPVGDTRSLLVPHIEIDPSKSATYYIDLPPPTIYGVYSMVSGGTVTQNQLGSYRLCSTIINPLSFGTASTPTISMVMYLSLVGAKIVAPTVSTRYNWTALEEEQQAPDGGVISGVLTKAAAISKTLAGVVPGVSEPLTLFSKFSNSTASFLSWFGFSKPIVQDVSYMVPGAGHNYTKVDNKVRMEQLSMRSNNSISVTGHDIPLFKAEEMEVDWLCRKKGLIAVSDVQNAYARDTEIWRIPVTPCDTQLLYGSNSDEAELTPLAYAALPYRYWRGDLVFTLEVVASVFSRCTLFVAWDPVGTFPITPTVSELSQVLKHWVIEVSGSTTTEIRIPWKQHAHFCERYFPEYGVHVEPSPDQRNGSLILLVMNPLVQNGSTDAIFVNTYIHGENMRFGWCSIEAGVNEYNIAYPMSAVVSDQSIFTSMTRVEDNFFGKFFGEEHAHTIKELASRMTFHEQATAVEGDSQHTRRFLPYESGTGLSPLEPIKTLGQFLSLAYVGFRGSINTAWMIDNGPANTTVAFFDLVRTYNSSDGAGFNAPGNLWTGTTTMSSVVNSVTTVNVPYYYNGLFKPSYTYFNTEDAAVNVYLRDPCVVSTMVGIGDDAVFVGFRGVPMLKFPGLG